MYRKNTASQFIAFQGVDATTGGIKSGVTWTVRRCIDGTFAAATGTATEDGTTGWYKFAMSQADTNGNNIEFNFTGTGAVPQTVNILTDGSPPDINVKNLLGTAWLTPGTAGTPDVNVKLWNGLTTVALPLIPTVAGRTLDCSAGGEAGLDWANIGSPTISVALTGTTIAVTQKVDVDTIKTNPVVNAGTVTFPTTATLASTTNITAGTITTVTTVTTATNLTNAPTNGDFTATMKTSAQTAADAAITANALVLEIEADTDTLTGFITTAPPTSAAIATAVFTTQLTESYAAVHVVPTLAQAIFEVRGLLAEASVASTTLTVKKVDGSTSAKTYTLSSSTAPTSITNAS